MGPTPRKITANGRSPLVNQQRQITSFFTKRQSASPSPSSSPSPATRAKNPSPNPKKKKQQRSPSPSTSPATPSPVPPNPKKPLLVVGGGSGYGDEVVGKRVRVYWPMDKAWYEGRVKMYDAGKGMHSVEYDDGEEEELELGKERVEWVEEEKPRRLKRLRKVSLGFSEAVVEDVEVKDVAEERSSSGSEDSSDESWGANVGKVVSDDEDVELELEDDEEEEKGGKRGRKVESKKRKASGGAKSLGSGKKSKCAEDADKDGGKTPLVQPSKNRQNASEPCNGLEKTLMEDAAERFGRREAEKFPFLGSKRRDGKRRCPGDKGYDPRTLYLPPDFIKSLSSGQRQWWEFKSKHMDKVLFFKMGKFYELFEMDAHTGAKELDLQYMKGEQPHCGFPEKNFSMNVEKLARKGYRVLVVEQTETPEQLEMRRKQKGSKDKVVKREICAVVTKGTLTEGELQSANPDASYLMAVAESFSSSEDQNFRRSIGVCLVDVATSRVILGQFEDDAECSLLCCLLAELRPVELIKPVHLLSAETERALLRHTRNPLVNELIPLSEFWDAEKTVSKLKTFYKLMTKQADTDATSLAEEDRAICLPDVLLKLHDKGEDGSLALSALGGSLYYLKQAFLDETLLRFAKFELLPLCDLREVSQKPYMILDAAALENLEIFENSRNGDSSGTLYAQLNHCATACGKRMLKTWLARPLYHAKSIISRQDAIAGLRGINQSAALEFRKLVSGLPDIERLLARIFASSEANGRNANNVVLYEDAAKKQLKEFILGLRGCELMNQACSSLSLILENVGSELLHHLLTPGIGRPDIHLILTHLKGAFDWVEANETGRIVPHKGGDKEYDSACQKVEEIKSNLLKHIKEQRRLLGDSSISYVTIGKDTYLLEIPEHLRGSIPQDYELQSSKTGVYRYWNPDIKKFLKELSVAESEKESALKSILQRLIGQFSEYHEKWRQLVSVTAELDVLISLAITSEFYEGPACRPTILSSLPSEVPCISAKSLGHPVLRSDSLGKGSFVPNDVSIGGPDCSSFILLTGPNMGGKSTLLRQVCLTAILAQVGADVPAESFVLSPVDRIFVRMGAKDHIMAGQSTFLTELSETALMLSSATSNSLVALDELGRGTSTSDGQAIAESVLEHFVHKVHCRGMFSTHYHRLAVHYEKNPKVSLCHMACQVENEDGGIEEVTFLYRLTPGACPKSYGVNVARLAGLPDSVLQRAADKSGDFEAFYGKHRKGSEKVLGSQRNSNKFADIVKNLIQVATDDSCRTSSESSSIKSLVELQHRARALVQT